MSCNEVDEERRRTTSTEVTSSSSSSVDSSSDTERGSDTGGDYTVFSALRKELM